MDALELNGTTFVKATAIARELGYTADYVGQLCRAGKVDAQLVGRSWYVSEDSIRNHKQSRYRSNKAKTASALKETIHVTEQKGEDNESVTIRPYFQEAPKNFYARSKEAALLYREDRSELIPTLTKREVHHKPQEVEVIHADAKPIEVEKISTSYDLEPTARPKIRFKGEVTIVEPEEVENKQENKPHSEPLPEVESEPVKEEIEEAVMVTESPEKEKVKLRILKEDPKEKQSRPSKAEMEVLKRHKHMRTAKQAHKKTSKIAVTAEADTTETEPEKLTLTSRATDGMTRKQTHTKQQGELTVTQMPANEVTPKATGRYTFAYITASLLLALLLGAGFMLLESSVVATGDTVDTQYNVNVSTVLDSLNGLK